MALRKIPIQSSVSVDGIISYTINHDVGALYATCSLEMLTTNALMIDDEVTLENEVFRITNIRKKPHRRGSPRITVLDGRSKADIFETTTIDNDLSYVSYIGLGRNLILYDGFDSPDESPLNENGVFKGSIMKARKCGCFGENGWTAHDIIKDMVEYTEVAKVEITCMDYDVLRVDFSAGTSVADAARQLFGMFNPFIYAQAEAPQGDEPVKPTLFIIPTSDPQEYDWPNGSLIDQDVTETKLDDQVKMVIIIGGAEYDDDVPNPCDPDCPEEDVEAILTDLTG